MSGNVKKETDSLQIRKPKYQEHDSIQGVAKRIKRYRPSLSSYSDFEIDATLLLEISRGNEKLVKEVQDFILEQQKEDAAVGGFLAIGVFRICKEDLLSNGKSEWIHVVFDHGLYVTLIACRIGHSDWTYNQSMDKSLLYSMAHMMINQ
ncbi:hypothetical protein POF51_26540 [Brevibacillus sp. AG]|uniref:hypothetical protein n=1 Tax=Brevibacillus sp. AG TaxID=3020891 RepID=UPI00232C015A|nr:hypothetical protein [Brevibacillus sp. AG]MDC0764283.1 hypothetical protein [Brevibacillus sp. AG]